MAKFDPQEVIDEQVESIDEAIAAIDSRMKPYEALAEKRQQLMNARRALLGATNRLTGGVAKRITLEEILKYVKENPGSAASGIAQYLGVSGPTISSHLYRNKDRFIKKNGVFYVRDPKAGMDTEDDIEDNEDD